MTNVIFLPTHKSQFYIAERQEQVVNQRGSDVVPVSIGGGNFFMPFKPAYALALCVAPLFNKIDEPMNIIFLMIGISLLMALVFLSAFLWAQRSGQNDDLCTPAIRILVDDTPPPPTPHDAQAL